MIEAMACGTPVIAWRRGSVPEVVDDGVTGFIVASEDEAVAAVRRVADARPAPRSARVFERRFSATVMARALRRPLPRGWPTTPASARGSRPEAARRMRRHRGARPLPSEPAEPADAVEPRAPPRLFALKDGDTFLVADAFGDILGGGDGLFRDDTRILSRFRLTLGGKTAVAALGARISQDNVLFTANLANQPAAAARRRAHARGRHPRRARALPVGGPALRADEAHQLRASGRRWCRSASSSPPTSATCSRCGGRGGGRAASRSRRR